MRVLVLGFALVLASVGTVTLTSHDADAGRRAGQPGGVAKAVSHLEPKATRRWPESFAGLWEERGGSASKAREFGLKPTSLSLAAGERRTIPLAFEDGSAVGKLQRLLKRKAYRRGSGADIDVRVTDTAGNSTSRHLELKLAGGKSRDGAHVRRPAASAPIQLGQVSPLSPSDCGGAYNFVQAQTGGAPSYEVPADGTITRWSHNGGAGDAGSGRLQVWRHATGTSYKLIGRSDVEDFGPGPNGFATRIAARKGDLLGVRTDAEAGCVFGAAGTDVVRSDGAGGSDPGPGAIRNMALAVSELRANVAATLQRDESLAFDADAAALQSIGQLQLTLGCPAEACRVEITGAATARRQRAGKRVYIALTDKAKQRVRKLRRGFPKPGMLRPVLFERSMRELEAQQERMIADRETFRSTGAPFPAVTDQLYDLDIDVKRNAPVVIMQHPTDATTAAFRQRYGPDVIVEAGPPAEPHGCSSRVDCPTLRSGVKTLTAGRGACSTAFTSYLGRSGKVRGVLSAAHCGGPNPTYPNPDLGTARYHGSKPAQYGTVYKEQLSGAVDAEWHYASREPFKSLKPAPRIYLKDAYKDIPVKGDEKASQLVVGPLTICKSGITTGYSCGVVKSKSYSPSYVPSSHDFVKATYCAQHGDSGAGVYIARAYRAVGIHSGGAKDTPCSDPKHYALFGHIDYAERALGVKVAIAAKP